jgi:hypothetical protein
MLHGASVAWGERHRRSSCGGGEAAAAAAAGQRNPRFSWSLNWCEQVRAERERATPFFQKGTVRLGLEEWHAR